MKSPVPLAREYPRQPEKFRRWRDRLLKNARENSVLFRIEPMLVFEVQALLHAYYGGPWRMLWKLFRVQCYISFHGFLGSLQIKFCDWMGWTKLYYYHETTYMRPHWRRHGRKCSGSPNCANMNCIDDSIPNWFKKLTRWNY